MRCFADFTYLCSLYGVPESKKRHTNIQTIKHKKMRKSIFSAILTLTCASLTACTVYDNPVAAAPEEPENPVIVNPTPKEMWGETLKGGDYTIPQLPDLFVNYWEYSFSLAEYPNLMLRISGEYPKCRYFSFSTYNDDNGDVISGLSDFQITPDDGCVNPFVVTSDAKNTYTVYLVPANMTNEQVAKIPCKNIIRTGEGINKVCLMIREYLGIDEYGGVEMPTIQAFNINTMKEVAAPKRGASGIWREPAEFKEMWSDSETDVPFMLAPRGSFYPNNETNYLFCRTAIDDDQVMTYSFIPAPHPSTVEENADAPCRYWSMCFGSQLDTRSYYSIYDEQANVPDGEKATFVVCVKQNSKLADIEKAVNDAKEKGQYIYLTVWDRERASFFGPDKPIGKTITIMYRNILPNKNWEHSMAHMKPTPYGDAVKSSMEDPEHMQADLALGEYGPRGKKVKTEDFLSSMTTKE